MDPKNEPIALPVDIIRTVAIVMVILLHAAIEPTPNIDIMSPQGIQVWLASDVYNSIARVAVPLFVMLTGALILQPNKVDEPLRVFFKKRWNRIGIPILFWGVAYFAWDFFVRGYALTSTFILQGVLAGPYFHFWYLYILVGLYLITPLLRVVVAHADWRLIKYFLVIWFIGSGIIPLLALYASISPQIVWFRQNIFLFTGLLGYFILGAYITKFQLRKSILGIMLFLSSIFTIMGTYFLVATLGEQYGQVFLDASSFSVIIASVALFLMLASISTKTVENRFPRGNHLLNLISLNTLPIYFLHIIILETLQKGYLGFKISVTTMNPVIEIPLITTLTLLICIAIIVPLKKVPYLNRIIG
ncbi:MAG TPA: acyltransferase family protein [Candidatus Binatia bacterium]|nr:acyltransferase family protein [Candidatus Binatia bacterium]